jgi:hypothetical protein
MMELLSPWSLLWLGLVGPLVLLYVLKRRRQPRVVGSTLLWEQALRDLRAERPWRRLVPQVALLLQLLALVVGALALARPVGAGTVPAGARVAVVIDASASMAARDPGADGSRHAEAVARARALVRSLPPGGDALVIEAAAQPVVVAPATADAAALERALSGLRVRGGRADLGAAVALAAERLRGARPGSRVVLYTDAAEDGEVPLDPRGVPVEVRRLGSDAAANAGIVAVDVRPRPDDGAPDRCDVFVRVAHHGARPADLFVTASIDGRGVVASRRVTVAPDTAEGVVLSADLPPDEAARAPVVTVALSAAAGDREGGAGDALALDDVAVAPSPAARRLPVFAVGEPPPPVMRALRADRDVDVYATSLALLAERPADAPPLDGLFVYTGVTPPEAPPGDSVVFAPTGPRAFDVELGPEVAAPRIVSWEEDDLRLRFVTLSDVHLDRARTVRGGARPLVAADAGAVIAAVARPAGETTIVAFDPAASDWPTRPSFVVFVRNLVERARQRRAAGGVPPGLLGEPLRVPARDGEEVVVRTPAGRTLRARARGALAVVPVDAEPGVYTVEVAGRSLRALRNLLDPSESDVRPRARFTTGGAGAEVRAAERSEGREAWPFLVGALLVLLVLEALWATREGAS